MEGKHKARTEETIRQLVAELLVRKVKDPRVTDVSILKVETSKDYAVAKVYYNIIGGGGQGRCQSGGKEDRSGGDGKETMHLGPPGRRGPVRPHLSGV